MLYVHVCIQSRVHNKRECPTPIVVDGSSLHMFTSVFVVVYDQFPYIIISN